MNSTQSRQGIHCNRRAVKQADTKDVEKQTKTIAEDNDVRDMPTRLYNLEFMKTGLTDRKSETSRPREDQRFKKILQEGTKMRTGHSQVPLPFKDPYIDLPNNRHQARQRFRIWRNNSAKNDQFREDYISFI